MTCRIIEERLIEAYTEALSPESLQQFKGKDQGLAGVFLPHGAEEGIPLMIVGMETRSWNGHFSDVRNANLRTYIEASMNKHRAYLGVPVGKSSFGRFHQSCAQAFGVHRDRIGWGNLLAVSHNRRSPIGSDAMAAILDLSSTLLRKQLEIIKPKAVIFVSGWRYDKFLKRSLDGLISGSQVHESKALWEFKLGDTRCFRTSHPRYVAGRRYRDEAIRLIRDGAEWDRSSFYEL